MLSEVWLLNFLRLDGCVWTQCNQPCCWMFLRFELTYRLFSISVFSVVFIHCNFRRLSKFVKATSWFFYSFLLHSGRGAHSSEESSSLHGTSEALWVTSSGAARGNTIIWYYVIVQSVFGCFCKLQLQASERTERFVAQCCVMLCYVMLHVKTLLADAGGQRLIWAQRLIVVSWKFNNIEILGTCGRPCNSTHTHTYIYI